MSLQVRASKYGRNGSHGDPGIFGVLGKVGQAVVKVASRIPGPIGVAGAAVSKLAGARPPVGPGMTALPVLPTPGFGGMRQRLLPGGSTGFQVQVPGEIGSPAGYHVNRTGYWLKDGTRVEAGTRWVRNRHRNPLNPRAASRAIGRIESLKKATKRFGRITIRAKSE